MGLRGMLHLGNDVGQQRPERLRGAGEGHGVVQRVLGEHKEGGEQLDQLRRAAGAEGRA